MKRLRWRSGARRTSTEEKAERLKDLGASDVINYTETPDWDVKARELTDGRGVDCVIEIGGPSTGAGRSAATAAVLCARDHNLRRKKRARTLTIQ